jgi:hypothetical protein
MARIEKISDMNQVNLSASVGRNGVNNKNDVLAVQALMKYGLEDNPDWRGMRFPEPTGTFDGLTLALIKRYQRHLKRLVSSAKVDGRIDPAKGTFTAGGRVMWTILSLNSDAMATWIFNKQIGSGYIHAIGQIYPAFKSAIGDGGVGTLNLELEGSGIGTLGLELE